MLDYKILDIKPKIDINNEQAIDLLSKSLDLDKDMTGQFVEVNEYYVARPDLISLAIYGDDKYADIICKVNGISNPFELNEGQIIFLPSYESINNILITNNKNKKTEKLGIEDETRIATDNKIGEQKRKDERRSPSQQLIGDKNYIIDKSLGIVFY